MDLIAEQKNKELQEMRDRGESVVVEQNVTFPLFDILLVLGLFYVSKSHIKCANKSVDSMSADAPIESP